MKILIAGGTGFIGSSIVKHLKYKNFDLTILSRQTRNNTKDITFIQGDVTDPKSLSKIKWNFDVIINCVQFPNHPVENPKKGFTYHAVDGIGTENLCQALKGTKLKRIIYISGAGTSETSAKDNSKPWFKAKWMAESAIKNLGCEYVILRPSWIYGPGDRSMSRLMKLTALPVVPVIGNGSYRASPLFIDDFTEIVLQSLTSESAKNHIIEVGGPQSLTMNEILKCLLEFKKRSRPLFHQPLWMMRIAGHFMEALMSAPPLSSKAVDFITMDHPLNSEEVEKYFKIKMRPLEEGLKSYK